jgi:uncharacterized protein (DUF488 family)
VAPSVHNRRTVGAVEDQSNGAAEILFTVGHSTHPIEEFVRLLQAYSVDGIVDVRTIPKSRHNPQFNESELAASLAGNGIGYRRMTELGGLRRARADSINAAWKNASFRGYADYMQTDDFARAIEALVALARTGSFAIMCAEAVPWRCHRSLIGDALVVRGLAVRDIMSETSARPHVLTSFARVDGTRITYPALAPSETT